LNASRRDNMGHNIVKESNRYALILTVGKSYKLINLMSYWYSNIQVYTSMFFSHYGSSFPTSSSSELASEILNHIAKWQNSLEGGSACRKASTYRGQHRHRETRICLNALSGIRAHYPSVRKAADSTRLGPNGYCCRLINLL
jgi:hypothetical protein